MPLTASLSSVPSDHNGSKSFEVRLTFSEEPDISYKTVRDTMFTVTGGNITGARRVKPPHDLEYDIVVKPAGNNPVSLSLAPQLPACDESGAVCTADGQALEGTVSATDPRTRGALGGGRDGAGGARGDTRLRGDPGQGAGCGGDGGLCHLRRHGGGGGLYSHVGRAQLRAGRYREDGLGDGA